jgi:UDP:flavonoid glycosyltransferase YjiC (YdhE family)
VITGGGSGLAQSLAHGKLCVVAPTAKDQPHRIRAAESIDLVEKADLEADAILEALMRLKTDPSLRAKRQSNLEIVQVENGLPSVVRRAHALLYDNHTDISDTPTMVTRKNRPYPMSD